MAVSSTGSKYPFVPIKGRVDPLAADFCFFRQSFSSCAPGALEKHPWDLPLSWRIAPPHTQSTSSLSWEKKQGGGFWSQAQISITGETQAFRQLPFTYTPAGGAMKSGRPYLRVCGHQWRTIHGRGFADARSAVTCQESPAGSPSQTTGEL